MTIRSGGRPRDNRSQAHPATPETPAPREEPREPQPEFRRPAAPGNGYASYGRGRRSGGFAGIIRFLVFALVLAAIVLVAFVTILRPVVKGAVINWAADNPGSLGMPFVADLVKEDLGPKLTAPGSADGNQVQFIVNPGETASSIASRLEQEGFLQDHRAFVLLAVQDKLTGKLSEGTFILRRSMTPQQLVTALLDPQSVKYIDIALRTGLRLEQITAKLETVGGLTMDPHGFYELAKHPTPQLLADYPWLELPKGASLEGYLWPATYRVLPDTTGEELVRLMLDRFHTAIGDRMKVPAARGMSFYQVLTLASLVEHEAILDEERPLIAGVYQNRLDGKLGHRKLQADPTVIYAVDTLNLKALDFANWREYAFWNVPAKPMNEVTVPADLQGYQTYQNEGLIPGPISTPTLASIDAALTPDTRDGYVFFVAKRDGSNGHAFAKSRKEFDAFLKKYGYQ